MVIDGCLDWYYLSWKIRCFVGFGSGVGFVEEMNSLSLSLSVCLSLSVSVCVCVSFLPFF